MNTPDSKQIEKDLGTLVHDIVGIGTSWARFGLTVGKTALETSAKTLTTTAQVLADVSKKLEDEAAAKPVAPAHGQTPTASA